MSIACIRPLVLSAVCVCLLDAVYAIEGPFVEFVRDDEARISWRSAEPCTASLTLDPGTGSLRCYADDRTSRDHAVTVNGLERPRLYRFQIIEYAPAHASSATEIYQFDSALDYLPGDTSACPSPYPEDRFTIPYAQTAESALGELECRQGYCLVLGCADGRLAFEIARRSQLQVIAVEEDAAQTGRARRFLRRAGIYGERVTVHQGRLDNLPYAPRIFNLIVSDSMLRTGELPAPAAEVCRQLRPCGGVLYLGQWGQEGERQFERGALERWLTDTEVCSGDGRFVGSGGLFWVHRRGALAGAGEWTHQYASGTNSACSNDDLVRGDLGVAWWGLPGPRPMPNRGKDGPAPLSCNGRLFVQGDRCLFGLDAYNGTILWSVQLPGYLLRSNLVHGSSNMAATDDALYLAGGPDCFELDARTGQRLRTFRLPEDQESTPVEWGFVGCAGDLLLGSVVPGEAPGQLDEKVVSLRLFAADRNGAQRRWTYARGPIINTTITFDQDAVYFIEIRNPPAGGLQQGCISGPLSTQLQPRLVALDLATGKRKWERPCDFGQFMHMAYLCLGSSTLIAVGSDGIPKKPAATCHTYAFDATDGRLLWERHEPDRKNHHSGWLGHPVIVGDQLCYNMQFVALRTGRVLREDNEFAWHGCGTASASRHAVFRRYQFVGMWDVATGRRQELFSVRSGCWLNVIAAGGMLLVPEASAGCICWAYALQTSVALAPREEALEFANAARDFLDAVDVTLCVPRRAGDIRYTLDGTEPGSDSLHYVGPIRLTDTATICAAAFRGGTRTGAVARATFTRLIPHDPVKGVGAQPGLLVEHYPGHYLYHHSTNVNREPFAAAVAPDVAAAMQRGLELAVAREGRWHDNVLRVSGYVEVSRDGVYEFLTTSGEYSALSVAGEELVNTFDFKHSTIERSSCVALRAGKHRLVVLYGSKSEHRGRIDLRVEYAGPDLPRRSLPAEVLSH